MKKQLLHLFILLNSLIAFSQFNPITPETKISILTVDVANESHTLYGHTAIRINDEKNKFDYVWNYGMFDFRTENFILKFVKGDLQYYVAAYPFADFEYSYQQENRSIYEQVLNISFEEKQKLFDKLNKSLFSEDKLYTYKFIDRNCTTKAIDIVNETLIKKPIKNTLHKEESYRSVLFPYQEKQYWLNLGINIIFGHRPDEQAAVLFLPLDLMKVLDSTQYDGKPLVEKKETLFQASQTENGFSFWNSCYALILFLLPFAILNKKATNIIFFSILGLIGLFFCLVGLYSLHKEVLWNYNVLLFNPLLLVLIYFLFKDNLKATKKVSLISLLCLGTYVLYMFNKAHLIMILPILLTSTIILLRLYLKKETN